ncbi:MAG: hypothetical protein GY772_17330 [bacterium]|nr:hypothetical protein [bacterium]
MAEAAELGAAAASANVGKTVPRASIAQEEEESGEGVFALAVPAFRKEMLQGVESEDLAACQRVLSHFLQCGAGASAQGKQKTEERVSTHSAKKQKGSGASAQIAKKQKSAEASVEEAAASEGASALPQGWNMRYAAVLAKENWPGCPWPERVKRAHAVIRGMSREDVVATVPARLAEEEVARAHAPRPAWCSKCRNRGCSKCGPRE